MGVFVLGGNQVCDFARVLAQSFHFCSVCSVMQSNISFGVAHYHPLLEKVEGKCGNLICCNIHVYPFDVPVERAPYLNFVAHRREEAQFLLYVLAAYGGVLISSVGMVVLVVLIHIDGLATENELQGFVDDEQGCQT